MQNTDLMNQNSSQKVPKDIHSKNGIAKMATWGLVGADSVFIFGHGQGNGIMFVNVSILFLSFYSLPLDQHVFVLNKNVCNFHLQLCSDIVQCACPLHYFFN